MLILKQNREIYLFDRADDGLPGSRGCGHCSVNVPISRVTAVGREPWCTACVSLSPAPSLHSEQNGYTHGNGPVVRACVGACTHVGEHSALCSSKARLKCLYGAVKGGIFRVEGSSRLSTQ